MDLISLRKRIRSAFVRSLAAVAIAATAPSFAGGSEPTITRIGGHIPPLVRRSALVDRVAASESVRLAIDLPLRNQAGLTDLLNRLYDPKDPLYGRYLTSDRFADRFGPTRADYDAVTAWAKSEGLSVAGTHGNRALLDVAGPASAIEHAFALKLMHYKAPNGRVFRAPDSEPGVPSALKNKIGAVIGLDTAVVFRHHPLQKRTVPRDASGPDGGYSPSDIKNAYAFGGLNLTGAGQTLAVFELDGYTLSDVTTFLGYFGLSSPPIKNVLVDGFRGRAGDGANEVTLDIELLAATAPGASALYVYEGPNTQNSVLDTYNRIATDNLAKVVSTSWGQYESSNTSQFLQSENTIFEQYAAQGQTAVATGGDDGAYDDGMTLSVDDPGSQPYITAVGGTSLTTGSGASYVSETTWNSGSIMNGASGGGISQVWPIPSYQSAVGVITEASLGSTTYRNVPDVSLNSDPNTGYAIYFQGEWSVYGGCSCAAPIWAGYFALVNQKRATLGKSTLGFANPAIYAIGTGSRYLTDFHDIADGSKNLYYPAVAGYDLATGWGSLIGANLLTDLVGQSAANIVTGSSSLPILLQNSITGEVLGAKMSGPAITGSAEFADTSALGPTWKLVGAADFKRNGNLDLLFQNTSTYQISIVYYSGVAFSGYSVVSLLGGYANGELPGWNVVGVADINMDGHPDIIAQNAESGEVVVLYMNGSAQTGAGVFGKTTLATMKGWNVVAVKDMNGDGHPDLLLQNASTGEIITWYYNVVTFESYAVIRDSLTGWNVVGAADLNNSGSNGLILQNPSTGEIVVWYLSGSTLTGYSVVISSEPNGW